MSADWREAEMVFVMGGKWPQNAVKRGMSQGGEKAN